MFCFVLFCFFFLFSAFRCCGQFVSIQKRVKTKSCTNRYIGKIDRFTLEAIGLRVVLTVTEKKKNPSAHTDLRKIVEDNRTIMSGPIFIINYVR